MSILKKIPGIILAFSMLFALVACTDNNFQPTEKTVATITVTQTASEYFVGDEFSGGKLQVTYSDDTEQIVDITEDMLTGFDTSSAGGKGSYGDL
ncbi:MAG: hypothetical protein ACI4IU_02530 [Candidatus Limousia pullorum]